MMNGWTQYLLALSLLVPLAAGCKSSDAENNAGGENNTYANNASANNNTFGNNASGNNASQNSGDNNAAGGLTIRSDSFEDGGMIPAKFACEAKGGDNVSPHLAWSKAPESAAVYAVVMDDEDPPCGQGDDACRHWSIYNIPADVTSLAEGQDISAISGAAEGENYTGEVGYAGPCPPDEHTYRITVYALGESMPDVEAGTPLTRSQFQSTYSEHILAEATLAGLFEP